VRNWRDRRAFVDLPYRLHSNEPMWVPPLRLERHSFLMRPFNAFFAEGEVQLFTAHRDGRVVGRISAHIDHTLNAHQKNRWGLFGFLELEDDPEVAAALFDAAAGWLKARGRDRMIGPMDFRMNDESGILVDGYDVPPILRMNWHPPYYKALCEGGGLDKVVDLYMWNLVMSDRDQMLPILPEMAEKAVTDHGMKLRKMSRRHLRRELDLFGEIYNEAWRKNFGFVPYSKHDLDAYAQELQLAYDKDFFMVVEDANGEAAGLALTFPDLNQVLKVMNGRLLPLGWWHFLRRSKYIDRVRVGFLGVKPEYQHTGIAALMYVHHFDMGIKRGFMHGEMGWILETNRAMNRGMEAMHGRIVKRFRVYERLLEDDAKPAAPKGAAPA
jgi:GNAT superfamily N-acetyltransferase